MNVGDLFFSSSEDRHRLIVAAECPHDTILVVVVVTPKPWKEKTCWIYKPEHSSLEYDSLIDFAGAKVGPRQLMIDALMRDQIRDSKEPVDPAVIPRIQTALPKSWAPPRARAILTKRCCPKAWETPAVRP